jgi:phosphoribosylformylglycinamidine synthase subunit PurL
MSVTNSDDRHRSLGLTDDEYTSIADVLGREPNDLELAMYSVMWSEHCSYKSSRVHLGRLPSEGAKVIVGPGENAGVIDVGDGIAVAIRIESHNHPSFIEPYQGAATGVGGILRDIFTMGARPIALMDPLFVGPLEDAHSRYILDGIVRGVAGYGNSVGVPTVGGQITFDPTYRGNPLVNVFCLGVLRREHLVLARASGVGNLAVLLGSRTGRDGIGGVSVLASAGFSDAAGSTKRPSVQVGDPFEEKRLIEACLELLGRDLVVGIQDLGGAGLSCATSEIAARGGLGLDFDVSTVPRREDEMNPIEVMTSESQERMLAIVTPGDLPALEEVCRRWEVEASVVGTVTAPDSDGIGRLTIHDGPDGDVLASVPAASLADDAPKYRRPLKAAEPPAPLGPVPPLDEAGTSALLRALVVSPAWIYEQYDHELFLNTVLGPGTADATLLRLGAPEIPVTTKGLAISADGNPRWCALNPRLGTALTVVESALNVACTGARPQALVNCLNFGNPEHPEVMWQLSESIDGMAEAANALSIPVVGGNVSLYNESAGSDIAPTPVIAVVGLVEDLERRPPAIGWEVGDALVVLGPSASDLSGSRAATRLGMSGGVLSSVDLVAAQALIECVVGLVAPEATDRAPGIVHGIHAVKDGGLAVALAECAIASGIGAEIDAPFSLAELFAELPLRVVIATGASGTVVEAARAAGVEARVIGAVGGDVLVVQDRLRVRVAELTSAFNGRIPTALDAPLSAEAV